MNEARPRAAGALAGNVLLITVFSLLSPVIAFLVQVVIAANFGATSQMDAYFAGITLPMYAVAIILGSAVPVFMPVFIGKLAAGREGEAWQAARAVLLTALAVTSVLAAAGALLAVPSLKATVPGLEGEALRAASGVAVVTWLSLPASALAAFLTGISQARGRFAWPAAVPVIGAALNLLLLPPLIPRFGVTGVAACAAASALAQALLLLPALKAAPAGASFSGGRAALEEMWRLAVPALLLGVIIKCPPLVERHLASGMDQGSISHLGYAYRLMSTFAFLVSTGIVTVAFPRMAAQSALTEARQLWDTIVTSFRMLFLAVAPAITLGSVLAVPLAAALFERGRFGPADSEAVGMLLRVYLLALAPAALGNISGKAFYAVKDTRTLLIFGSLETAAYVGYTALLAAAFGVRGIALGYGVYLFVSMGWQMYILKDRFGRGDSRILRSFAQTGLCAAAGGAAAWGAARFPAGAWARLAAGVLAGGAVYAAALKLSGSKDLEYFAARALRRG